jgi:peptidoglycan/LPS O-acetylase OafA/YrhL
VNAEDYSSSGTVVPAHSAVYYPALDGIRASAFLMVFAAHYLNNAWGGAGVDIFFVLSGFLITGILLDSRDHPHYIRNFYTRRTLRIFPLYHGVLLLLLLSYPFFRWDWNWRWLIWPLYLGNFARGIHPFQFDAPLQLLADFQPRTWRLPGHRLLLGHFWTLCMEEQFYLIWPWVVLWVRDRQKLVSICLFFIAACPVARAVAFSHMPQFMLDQDVVTRWTPFRIDALLLGSLIALVRNEATARRMYLVARAGFVLLGAMALGRYIIWTFAPHFLSTASQWRETWGLSFVDILSACLIVMALEQRSAAYLVFSTDALRRIGKISYGAYVFHDIFHLQILWLVMRYGGSSLNQGSSFDNPIVAVIALLATLVLASCSYRWYESIFLRFKDRWTQTASSVMELEEASAS